jgi:2-hydroxychromene-2-carboxylate isomerase
MRVYFDFVSPYAYVAWRRLPALAARHGRAIVPVPVVFGALLSTHGIRGPAEVPAKRSYLLKDVYRKARRAGAPFVLPPAHPFNPLLALRVASLPMPDDARVRLVDTLFTSTWGGGRGVESPESVARAAGDAGLDGDALVRAASEPEAKARLRAQTGEAIAAGVFGVPTVVADGELFWGVDALEGLEELLDGVGRVPPELVAQWAGLPASVHRRG